jgi:hypothetical protein
MQKASVIRDELLELHRLLLEEVRRDYEREHGKVTPGQYLDLLVNDEAFAWLRSLTALIVELDESKSESVDDAWAKRARELLRPDAAGSTFQQRYDELLHRSPDVSVAHGATMRAMRA